MLPVLARSPALPGGVPVQSPPRSSGALTIIFAACQIGLLRGPLGAQIPFVGAAFAVLLVGVLSWHGRSWSLTRAAGAERCSGTDESRPGALRTSERRADGS